METGQSPSSDAAVFESAAPDGRGWNLRLEHPLRHYVATAVEDVHAVLAQADVAASRGEWAAVMVGYEAAAAFDGALRVLPRSDFPLVHVSIYGSGDTAAGSGRAASPPLPDVPPVVFRPAIDADAFETWVRSALEHILQGDIYQVNLTFPMIAPHSGGLEATYGDLLAAQHAPYCARFATDDYLVLSFSPELFFSRTGNLVTMRPMKGTSPRGRYHDEDEALARALAASAKERAGNVMIVDLMRNDIGRVACVGTVSVPRLYDVERYPTLWQMTSMVQAEVPPWTSLIDLFAALFPSGSVTGAPKVRAMEVIAEHERLPRGLYTGALGFVAPGGDCIFNVAIRTIVIDRRSGVATMGVGAGITADSVARDEYRECLLKADFIASRRHDATGTGFELLETMRLECGAIARLARHLYRLEGSARYWSFPWRDAAIRQALDEAAAAHPTGVWRLRLTVDRHGKPSVSCTPHTDAPGRVWLVARASSPVDDRDPFLFNKTTRRDVYDAARGQRPDADDVLLWNRRGEVTESTIANVVAEIDGRRYTPPLRCGLLPGAFRQELLDEGAVFERVLRFNELQSASRLWLVNSLRGWMPASIVD